MMNITQENESMTKSSKITSCKDGVFSNLNAKPEVIRIEELDLDDRPPVSRYEKSNNFNIKLFP